jgi:tetratricopeptide (TPR) repeat protein
VLLRLQVPGAWLGAALWALHPVQVESTAWVSEMKNTQSGLFYLLSILFFLKYLKVANREERGTTSWNYTFTLLFAALAMASKFSTSILPAVMVLVAWWHQGQWRWRNLLLLAPIFAMSFIASVAAIWPHPSPFGTFQGFHDTRGWSERLAMAGDVIWFYLGKLIWPYPLMAIYPRWSIDASSVTSYLPLSAAIAVSVALWLKRNSQARPFFFAWSYFIVAVSPFLTLIDQTFWVFSFVEDHLQYLASMGPLALIGAGLARIAEKNIFRRWHIGSIVTVIILLTLGALSWQRSWAFESVKANFLDTLSKNPKCWLAYNDVGFSLVAEGNFSDAIADFDKAIALNPRYADAYANLGVALALQGRYEESIVRFERALEIQPKFASAHNNLGASLEHQGRLDEAISQYKEAINENPYYQQAQDNLSRTEIEYALRQRPR